MQRRSRATFGFIHKLICFEQTCFASKYLPFVFLLPKKDQLVIDDAFR